MTTYIALLRGINVSGKKLIKMEDLRVIFESLQYNNVKTYIQSGNVFFSSTQASAKLLSGEIEKKLQNALGYTVAVLLRTLSELDEVIRNNPFKENKAKKNEKIHVTFLAAEPDSEAILNLESFRNETDDFRVMNREVYILCRGGYGKTLFSNNFFEKKLGVLATTRNWDTINKLASLGRS
jgi:uncharacterized protein (DUF1697 family)